MTPPYLTASIRPSFVHEATPCPPRGFPQTELPAVLTHHEIVAGIGGANAETSGGLPLPYIAQDISVNELEASLVVVGLIVIVVMMKYAEYLFVYLTLVNGS